MFWWSANKENPAFCTYLVPNHSELWFSMWRATFGIFLLFLLTIPFICLLFQFLFCDHFKVVSIATTVLGPVIFTPVTVSVWMPLSSWAVCSRVPRAFCLSILLFLLLTIWFLLAVVFLLLFGFCFFLFLWVCFWSFVFVCVQRPEGVNESYICCEVWQEPEVMPSSSDEPDDKEKDAASCVETGQSLDFVTDTHRVQPWCRRCSLLMPTPARDWGMLRETPQSTVALWSCSYHVSYTPLTMDLISDLPLNPSTTESFKILVTPFLPLNMFLCAVLGLFWIFFV